MIFFQETANQIFDIVTPVIKIAGTWNLFAIHNLLGTYIGNIGQSCKHTFSVQVTESPFDFVLRIQLFINGIILLTQSCKMLNLRSNLK